MADRQDWIGFARREIAARDGLHETATFPDDLWQALGNSGLLGLGIAEAHGGGGGDYRTLADCAYALAEAGGNKGVVTTWLVHNMAAKLHIEGLGTPGQQRAWLPRLAAGEFSVCVAISEPGAGAHPKHLQTAAVQDGDSYILNGEKAYLTNGPLAGLFIVLAITGERTGRKRFSAFLVPRDTPGFEQTPGIEIDYLRPSGHCGIRLTDCRVPAGNLLGTEGDAFKRFSLRMRAVEDALGTAASAGSTAFLLAELARLDPDGDDRLNDLGRMAMQQRALRRLSQAMAEDLDAALSSRHPGRSETSSRHPGRSEAESRDRPRRGASDDPGYRLRRFRDDESKEGRLRDDEVAATGRPSLDIDSLNEQSAGFREISVHLQNRIDGFIKEARLTPGARFDAMRRDLVKSRGIARSVHQVKAIRYGRSLIADSLNAESKQFS